MESGNLTERGSCVPTAVQFGYTSMADFRTVETNLSRWPIMLGCDCAAASYRIGIDMRLASIGIATAIAALPACVSLALNPWLYQTVVSAPATLELTGDRTLVELARIGSLRIYTGNLQTLMTPAA